MVVRVVISRFYVKCLSNNAYQIIPLRVKGRGRYAGVAVMQLYGFSSATKAEDLSNAHLLSDGVEAIVRYWEGIRPADGRLPGRVHFDPVDIPELLRCIWLVEVCGTPPRFRCRVCGTALVEAFGVDYSGKHLDEVDEAFSGSAMERDFLAVINRAKPLWWRGPLLHTEFADVRSPHHPVNAEVVLLPLASDGVSVDMILCYAQPIAGSPQSR